LLSIETKFATQPVQAVLGDIDLILEVQQQDTRCRVSNLDTFEVGAAVSWHGRFRVATAFVNSNPQKIDIVWVPGDNCTEQSCAHVLAGSRERLQDCNMISDKDGRVWAVERSD
jgi:hypothetical protein